MKVAAAGILGFAGMLGIFWIGGMEFERGPRLGFSILTSLATGFAAIVLGPIWGRL